MYDIAIIGKGPAGISAAISACSRGKKTIIFGGDSKKVLLSPLIDNYPGLPNIKGPELMESLNNHLRKTTTTISEKTVLTVYSMGTYFSIQAQDDIIESKKVIITTGVNFKKSIENEDKFLGRGVSYCATCDAALFKNKETCVIGYNEESIDDVNFLSTLCNKVYFIPMTNIKNKNIDDRVNVINDIPKEFKGNMKAEELILENSTIKCDGYFVIKDSYPLTSLVPGLKIDNSHIIVDKNMETNIKGLFAAGDVTGKPYQLAKAIGEGQVAALYE